MNFELIYLIAFLLVGILLFYLLKKSCGCNKALEGNSELEGELTQCEGEYRDECFDDSSSKSDSCYGEGYMCSDGKCFQCSYNSNSICIGSPCKDPKPPTINLPSGYCTTGYEINTSFCIDNMVECSDTGKYGNCDTNGWCNMCNERISDSHCEIGGQCKKPPNYCGKSCDKKNYNKDCGGTCNKCIDNPKTDSPHEFETICGPGPGDLKIMGELGYCTDNSEYTFGECPSGYSPLPYAMCGGEVECNASNCCVENVACENEGNAKTYRASNDKCYPACFKGTECNTTILGKDIYKPNNCVYLDNEDIGEGCSDGTKYNRDTGFQGHFEDLNGKPKIDNVFCQKDSQIVDHWYELNYRCEKSNSDNVKVFKTLKEFKDIVKNIPHLKDHPKLSKLLETHFPRTFKNITEAETFISNL